VEEPYDSGMGSVSETWRYIVRSPGVRNGNPIVANTRIAVHDVIGLLQNGCLSVPERQVSETTSTSPDHTIERD